MTVARETVRTRSVHRRRRAGAVLAALLLCTLVARAQDVTEPALKAAFVYNFAKFTEWPEDVLSGIAPFSACVLGDAAIADALERSVKGRLLSGHSVSVSRVSHDAPLRSCHLLYISGVTPLEAAAILAAVRGAPVLTISDLDSVARLGAHAHMFVESGRMRFEINLDLARRCRLQLSSKLLALAARVLDAPGVGKQ